MAAVKYTTELEDMPPEMLITILGSMNSATDLRSLLLASPKAAAVFIENKRDIIIKLFEKGHILSPEALQTGLKIHVLRFQLYLNVKALDGLKDSVPAVKDLSKEQLTTLYLLCLRHEPFVTNALTQPWLTAGTSKKQEKDMLKTQSWDAPRWWRKNGAHVTDSEGPMDWEEIAATLPQHLLSGFFGLELFLRQKNFFHGYLNEAMNTVLPAVLDGSYWKGSPIIIDMLLVCSVLDFHWKNLADHLRAMPQRVIRQLVEKGKGMLLHKQAPILNRYVHMFFTCKLQQHPSWEQGHRGQEWMTHPGVWDHEEDFRLAAFGDLTLLLSKALSQLSQDRNWQFPAWACHAVKYKHGRYNDDYNFYQHNLSELYEKAMARAEKWARNNVKCTGHQGVKSFLENGYRAKRALAQSKVGDPEMNWRIEAELMSEEAWVFEFDSFDI